MHNLVNKFTPDIDVTTDDEGVVAIEYVLVAGIVAAGIIGITFTGLWGRLSTKLNGIVPVP